MHFASPRGKTRSWRIFPRREAKRKVFVFQSLSLIIPLYGTIIPNMGTFINISNALFSNAQQQVLGLLYAHPNSDFHTNEIIRLSHIGTGAVQRELVKLTAARILTVKQVGNQKRYQANQSSPLFAELRSIILKTFGLADILKAAIIPCAEKMTVAFIYGSIAKQEDTAQSDIDLMIISEQLTYAEVFKLLEPAEVQLGRKINPTFYTPAEWVRKKNNHFILQVIKQPKIFLIGTENELITLG
jgi:predicted nucleotidyltransferase